MFVRKYIELLRAPESEGGGGDASADTSEGGEDKGESVLDNVGGDGQEGDQKASGDASGDQGGDAAAYVPKGLPDHMVGESQKDTLDNLFKAYKGARDKIAGGKMGEGDVPEKIDGYKIEPTGEDDVIGTELNSADSKPIVDAFRSAALDLGMTDQVFEKFMREGLGKVTEAGIPIGKNDEEMMQISAQAEMESLVSVVGDEKSAKEMLLTVDNFGQKLLDTGSITKDEQQEFRIMCGTAEGVRVMHKILVDGLGEKPVPLLGGGLEGEQVTQADAYAFHASALKMPAGSERDAALGKAEKMFEKAFGTGNATQVRSRVLS